jgi:ubiquinone biosynthesis protein
VVRRWIARELSPATRAHRLAEEAVTALRNIARLAENPPAPSAVAIVEEPRGGSPALWFALGALAAGLAFLFGFWLR